jgi:hypothetical protein
MPIERLAPPIPFHDEQRLGHLLVRGEAFAAALALAPPADAFGCRAGVHDA